MAFVFRQPVILFAQVVTTPEGLTITAKDVDTFVQARLRHILTPENGEPPSEALINEWMLCRPLSTFYKPLFDALQDAVCRHELFREAPQGGSKDLHNVRSATQARNMAWYRKLAVLCAAHVAVSCCVALKRLIALKQPCTVLAIQVSKL